MLLDAFQNLPGLIAESLAPAERGVAGRRTSGQAKPTNGAIDWIAYADDVVILAMGEQELQAIMDKLQAACEKCGLSINIGKTKTQCFGKPDHTIQITIDGTALECVKEFKYLGSWVTSDGKLKKEIQSRKASALAAWHK